MEPRLLSVNVSEMRLIMLGGTPTKTGIYKYPVSSAVAAADNQIGPDRQGNYDAHGGYDKAAYAYAAEDYEWWSDELGRALEPGAFGENLTVEGIDASGALVGERWRIGSAELEVSEPRIPCSKLAHKMGDPAFVKRFARALRPGAYLRIVAEGEIEAGDPIEPVSRPGHGVSVRTITRAYLGERDLLPQLIELESLSEAWRSWARTKLEATR